MRFTGKDLDTVRDALLLACDEVRNQIATCPDVNKYADDLDYLDDELVIFRRLIARVERAQAKETT